MRPISWRATARLTAITVVAAMSVASMTLSAAHAQQNVAPRTAPAHATASQISADPIGSGWKKVNPSKTIQVVSRGENHPRDWDTTTHAAEEGASYDRSGGVEKFRLLSNRSNRVEVRVHNDYKTGLRQFAGELRVSSPTNDESCMQIFGNDGPGATTLMIRAFSRGGGTLRGAGKDLITGAYRKWVRINVIHDATADTLAIYINGKLTATGKGPNGTHYFKYGVYGTLRTPSAQTEWRNVEFFQK